jgi:PIN domain nuclease of toxin-antitoxin system
MKYIIDTNVFLWTLNNDPKLSEKAKKIIKETHNEIYLSIASIWEIGIKISMNKLKLPFSFNQMNKCLISI